MRKEKTGDTPDKTTNKSRDARPPISAPDNRPAWTMFGNDGSAAVLSGETTKTLPEMRTTIPNMTVLASIVWDKDGTYTFATEHIEKSFTDNMRRDFYGHFTAKLLDKMHQAVPISGPTLWPQTQFQITFHADSTLGTMTITFVYGLEYRYDPKSSGGARTIIGNLLQLERGEGITPAVLQFVLEVGKDVATAFLELHEKVPTLMWKEPLDRSVFVPKQ